MAELNDHPFYPHDYECTDTRTDNVRDKLGIDCKVFIPFRQLRSLNAEFFRLFLVGQLKARMLWHEVPFKRIATLKATHFGNAPRINSVHLCA